uniref:Uncharacterized protein n=1 Tax=Glossina austeni TaxID=7395 RepID=A0A1A9VHK8_GLOAU
MSKLSLLAIVLVMIVKGNAKAAATKASITLANDSGDSLALSRNAAAILYIRKNNQHTEQHELNKRETMKEGAEEGTLHTNTEAEVILETVPNKVGKEMTNNGNVSNSTTTFKTTEALKEAEEVLREKVAEIEAEPVILSARQDASSMSSITKI